MRPPWSPRGWGENLRLPFVMPSLGGHTYLRPDFRLSDRSRRMLLARYHRAIELMDAKLCDFHAAASGASLLDDTLLIVTSDHGEGFGEHGLYLHDASLYETHLHVPLWIRHPKVASSRIDDVVGTRDLFGLMRSAGLGEPLAGTILDGAYRAAHPIALAEHFHYPHRADTAPRYRQNIAAAIIGEHKVILRREGVETYDLARDPEELAPAAGSLDDLARSCRGRGVPSPAVESGLFHLRRWRQSHEREGPSRPPRRASAKRAAWSETTSASGDPMERSTNARLGAR